MIAVIPRWPCRRSIAVIPNLRNCFIWGKIVVLGSGGLGGLRFAQRFVVAPVFPEREHQHGEFAGYGDHGFLLVRPPPRAASIRP